MCDRNRFIIADVPTSIYVTQQLSKRIEGLKFDKRNPYIAFFKEQLRSEPFRLMEKEYEVVFGQIYNTTGTAKNNKEIPIYLKGVKSKEKHFIGSLFILVPLHGNATEAILRNINYSRRLITKELY